ncbi:YPDG domain-containing protein, partial [Corynebacterium sp. ACRQJ]|uniref:YPDG domain-containing protein n=1 Tax=Corynebacterium sp. ACRQJ TaxID=2918189 RepID=UPI002715224E
MSNLRGRSIRTGFGAKALGFKNNSMKSIAAAGAVLALATTGTVVVQTQTAPAAVAQEAPAPTTEGTTRETAIEADAIANGYIKGQTSATNAANTLSGRAFEVDRGTPATFANGNNPVPDGTKVYMQWMDKDKSISPWYVTTVKTVQPSDGSQVGPGAYAFDLRKPWIDAHGKEHKYTASSGQYYRLVIPDYNTDYGNTMSMLRQAGGFFPGTFVNSVTNNNLGQFPLIGTNMQRTAVFMYEKPTAGYMTRPESEWIDDTEGPLRNASVNTSARNSISGKVWLETGAGDYANSATGPNDNGNDPQAENYTVVLSSLTSKGAQEYEAKVNSLPQSKRADAAKKLLTDHPEYISATVQAKTDADGRYTARFPEKTLNDQYIYGYVLNPEGQPIQAYSSYTSPQFRKPNENVSFTPQTAPAQNLTQRPMWYNVNFALVPTSQASLEITNFNATDKPAAPGDTLEISVNGTLSPLSNSIVWINSKGEEVKRCDNVTTLQEANKCTFKVPEDAANEEVYTAQLVVADNIVAADSAMVKIPKQADEIEPGYEDGSGKPGSDVKIDAPTFTDKDGKDTQAPEGTKFTPGENAPEGVKVDESTGEITVPVPEDAKPGDKITVPVEVTYPDGSKDNVDVTVTVEQPDAPEQPGD